MSNQIDKKKATLAELEAEKAKRLQAAVEAGEAVVLRPLVIIGKRGRVPTQEEIEAAKAWR